MIKMVELNIKQEYEKLKKKYKDLPSFEELDHEFELSSLDIKGVGKDFMSRAIRRRIADRVTFYTRILEAVLLPPSNPSPISIREFNSVSNERRNELMEVYNKLMDSERYNLQLNLDTDEKRDVEYIKLISKKIKDTKLEVLSLAGDMRKAWSQNDQEEDDGGYFS